MYGSNIYSYCNSQPGSSNKQYGIHDLQCKCIYIRTGQWSKWHSTSRNNLYMGSTSYSTCWIDNRRERPGSGPGEYKPCLLYTSPSPRDGLLSRMPSSA